MQPQHSRRTAQRTHFARNFSVALTALCASHTFAADASGNTTADTKDLEEVIVTGSRIPTPNQASSSPVLTVTAEDIKTGGRNDLTDMLNLLPQINSNALGQDLGNKTSGLSSAGGVATANLRGLGPNRTLVLVNGRRLGTGSPQTVIQAPAPDIDQIPSALVERVEVVTGGASVVYGSDAIAGVVNFITRKNFEGLEFDSQLGSNWHDNNNGFAQERLRAAGVDYPSGSTWDGRTIDFNVTAGKNFLDGHLNITAFAGYRSMNPVRSSQRDFGACQLSYTDSLDDVACTGSSNSNYFYPTNPLTNTANLVYSVKGHQFIEQGTDDTTPPASFNSQKYIYMQRQDKRYNAGLTLHSDVNNHLKPYAEFMFMDDHTTQEVAPTALFRQSNVLTDTGNYLINCSNPLLSASQAALLCTPAEIAADALNPGSVNADVEIGRRNIEGGPRSYTYQHRNYRLVLGSQGDIANGWTYDAYGQYYYTNFFNSNDNDFSFDKIANALQVTTDGGGNPVCISGPPCVPYNIFQDGGVTSAALAYLNTSGTAKGSTSMKTVHIDVTGDLDTYGIKLPTTSRGVGINVAYEYRSERLQYIPDEATLGGLIVGLGGAFPDINNSTSVRELSGEVRVPLISDRPGAYDLVAGAGYRYSDYSEAGGINTYMFDVQYAPIQTVRLRTAFNRAIRAPAIVELFVPQSVGKIQFGEDPCAPSESDGSLAATFEQCARTGVTADQYNNKSIPQGTADQLTQLQGGNTKLKPETADTLTLGVTWQPEALPGFTGSVDYYHIKLKNLISALPATVIMSNCLNTGDPVFCSQIVRNPVTGTLNGASVASGGYIVQTNVNAGAGELNGIDVQTAYKFDMAKFGSMSLMLNGAYLLNNKSTPIPGGASYDCAGLFGPTCQTVNPVWRHIMRAAWQLPSKDVTVALTWRYFSRVKLDNNDSDPQLNGSSLGDPASFRASMPATHYFDLATTWNIDERFQVRVGINNLFDKDPPIVPSDIASGGAPNYYEFYDGLGRQVFAGLNAKF